ncbi:hypothetical protein JCM1841_000344 [Sporobolomyces salmonicolor]
MKHPHHRHLVPLRWDHVFSSSPFTNPTSGSASPKPTSSPFILDPTHAQYDDPMHGIRWKWNARAHRKGVPPRPVLEGDAEKGAAKEGGEKEWKVQRRRKEWGLMELWGVRWWGWDWGDISWWVAFLFTVGSVWWCINGILFFCYFTNTSATFTNTEAAFAFLGGTTFVAGSYLGYVESLNPAVDAGEFAWIVDEEARALLEPSDANTSSLGRRRHHFGTHRHPHSSPSSPFLPSKSTDRSNFNSSPTSSFPIRSPAEPPHWRWFGFSPNLGCIANTIQLIGAVAFEVIGSPCFVLAGLVFCLETQHKWWKPNLTSLGWQIGFWNVVGGFGFWFCGIFGIWRQTDIHDPNHFQRYGTGLSTFWGSWAFLLGSYLQLLETLNKWQ